MEIIIIQKAPKAPLNLKFQGLKVSLYIIKKITAYTTYGVSICCRQQDRVFWPQKQVDNAVDKLRKTLGKQLKARSHKGLLGVAAKQTFLLVRPVLFIDSIVFIF